MEYEITGVVIVVFDYFSFRQFDLSRFFDHQDGTGDQTIPCVKTTHLYCVRVCVFNDVSFGVGLGGNHRVFVCDIVFFLFPQEFELTGGMCDAYCNKTRGRLCSIVFNCRGIWTNSLSAFLSQVIDIVCSTVTRRAIRLCYY